MSDEQNLRTIIDEISTIENGVSKGRAHMDDNCVFIRPSGNPLSMGGWDAMFQRDDVIIDSERLVDIRDIKIQGEMAYAWYVTHSQFTYKNVTNDDVSVFTAIFKKMYNNDSNGQWKMIHGQRSTGRKPDERPPYFD